MWHEAHFLKIFSPLAASPASADDAEKLV